jgi:hypothetical protein
MYIHSVKYYHSSETLMYLLQLGASLVECSAVESGRTTPTSCFEGIHENNILVSFLTYVLEVNTEAVSPSETALNYQGKLYLS